MTAPAVAEVPVRPAATVMVLDDRPDLHVLLLLRRKASVFVGGMNVFPGGAVDPHDAAPEVEAVCAGLSDVAASRRLGVERGGLAYWVAAVRETFEEAGVLLARDPRTGRPLDPGAPEVAGRLAAQRRAVDAGEARLADVVREAGLELTVDAMHYAARWVTPPGPPRRYDTRFFVTAMPKEQNPVPDRREATRSEWVRPAEALAHFASGERTMLPPTVGMLRLLAGYGSAEEVMRAALRDEDGPDRAVRMSGGAEGWRVFLPGDPPPPHEVELEGMRAWVRLRGRPAATADAEGAKR